MQRALARIEHAQGRKPEPGSRYHIVGGKVERRAPIKTANASGADIGEAKARWEAETGIKGFTRYCQNHVLAIIRAAQMWQDVHEGLAPLGIGIRQTASSSGSASRGSGGEFYAADGNKAKLSSVHRSISWGKLTARLGPYQAPELAPTADYRPDVVDFDQAQRHREQARAKDAALAILKQRIDALQAARQQAHALLRAQWLTHRADVKQLKIDRSRRELIEALRVIHTNRIKATDDAYRARLLALRSLRRSVGAFTEPHLLDIETLEDEDAALVISWSARRMSVRPVTLSGYIARQVGDAVQYWREGDDEERQPAFVERGDVIWINDRSQAALEAALILAKARYGDVAAFGNAQFVKACQQAGRRIGIDVQDAGVNPITAKAPKVNPRQAARDKALDAVLNARRAAPTQVIEPEMRRSEPTAPSHKPARGRPPRVPNPFGR